MDGIFHGLVYLILDRFPFYWEDDRARLASSSFFEHPALKKGGRAFPSGRSWIHRPTWPGPSRAGHCLSHKGFFCLSLKPAILYNNHTARCYSLLSGLPFYTGSYASPSAPHRPLCTRDAPSRAQEFHFFTRPRV